MRKKQRRIKQKTKSTYKEKLEDVLNSDQFQIIKRAKNETVIEAKEKINNSLKQLMKQGKFGDKFGQNFISTGSKPERFYQIY